MVATDDDAAACGGQYRECCNALDSLRRSRERQRAKRTQAQAKRNVRGGWVRFACLSFVRTNSSLDFSVRSFHNFFGWQPKRSTVSRGKRHPQKRKNCMTRTTSTTNTHGCQWRATQLLAADLIRVAATSIDKNVVTS